MIDLFEKAYALNNAGFTFEDAYATHDEARQVAIKMKGFDFRIEPMDGVPNVEEKFALFVRRVPPMPELAAPNVYFHGTSKANLHAIFEHGLLPRHETKAVPNHPNIPSRPDFVYVSKLFAPYFAVLSAVPDSKPVVLAVHIPPEVTKYPDEDYLRDKLHLTHDEHQAIDLRSYQHLWKESQDYLTNICVDVIHPEQIIAFAVEEKRGEFLNTVDGCSTLINVVKGQEITNKMLSLNWKKPRLT